MRFTIGRLMIAVAALSVVMGLGGMMRRRVEYSSRMTYHARQYRMRLSRLVRAREGLPPGPIEPASFRYHFKMAEKYEWAARYPWLPVAPDPPEPK
jgi:hypothetical protein